MRLLDFMRDRALTDDAMAARIGDCSGHAVKKWKYGEREPDASTMLRITAVTKGAVTVADWAAQASLKRRDAERRPKPAEAQA